MCDREIKVVGLGFALLRQDNGLQTTDYRQRRAKPAFGITELRINGIMKIGFALLCRTTDNRQQTTEGEAGSKLMARSS